MSAEAGSESDVATRNPFSTEEALLTNNQETKVTAELAFEATNTKKTGNQPKTKENQIVH